MSQKWLGIWHGFAVDMMKEWGFLELRDLRGREKLTREEMERIIAFVDKLALNSVIGLMEAYARILSSKGKADLDDIQQVAGVLEKFEAPQAVEKLKTAIKEFFKETDET
mgnify:CR=1 FL=1